MWISDVRFQQQLVANVLYEWRRGEMSELLCSLFTISARITHDNYHNNDDPHHHRLHNITMNLHIKDLQPADAAKRT